MDQKTHNEVRYITYPSGDVHFTLSVHGGGAPWLAEFPSKDAQRHAAAVRQYLLDYLPGYHLSLTEEWTTTYMTTFAPVHFRGRPLNPTVDQPAALH